MRCRAFVLCLVAAAAAAGDGPYHFREKVLANGLRVVTVERRSCPIVAVQVWYHVGSKDEAPDRQGFAHLFEHMMFRGTDRVDPHGHADRIRSVGGNVNACTSFDATYFRNELPAHQLELALWLEAERMAFLRIDEANFATERSVVEQELRERINQPYGTLSERVMAGVFRAHPYRWDPLGCAAHLRAATLEEVEAFWARYYIPSNAVLVIVGDVGHAEAQSLAERYFGWIPGGSPPARVKVTETPRAEPLDLRFDETCGSLPLVGVVVPGVPRNHPDAVPLRLLTSILGGANPSRIYREFMWHRQVAHNVYPYPEYELEDHGVVGVAAALSEPASEGLAIEIIEAQLEKLMAEPVEPEELTLARNSLRRADTGSRSTASSIAIAIGWAATLGDTDQLNLRLKQLDKVSADDLVRVARTYFGAPRRVRFRALPGKAVAPPADGPEPAPPPEPGGRVARRTGIKARLKRPATFGDSPPVHPPPATLPLPPHARHRLANRLEVVVVPNCDASVVHCSLSFRSGSAAEAKPGAAHFAMALLTRATAKHDTAALLELCGREGVALNGGADLDGAHLSATCYPPGVDGALGLLAEMVLSPRTDGTGLEAERKMMIRWLDSARADAATTADAVLCRHMFGNHPYARPASGETKDMRRLEWQDLRDWWLRFGRPDAAVLYVGGDVVPEAVFRSAEQHFGTWKAEGPLPEMAAHAVPEPQKRRIVIVNRAGSAQSAIRVGQITFTRRDPDWALGLLLSNIIGGSHSSRLNDELRKRRGLTYWADGGVAARREAGLFWMEASTETARTGEVVRALLDVLAKLRDEGPTAAEVFVARNVFTGSLAARWETPVAVIQDLWQIDSLGLQPDFIQKCIEAQARATPEELRRIARRIDPGGLVIVVVGDASKIHADLATIAPVTVQ